MKYIIKGSVNLRKYRFFDRYYSDCDFLEDTQSDNDLSDDAMILSFDTPIEWKNIGYVDLPIKLTIGDKINYNDKDYVISDVVFTMHGNATCYINYVVDVIEDQESKTFAHNQLEEYKKKIAEKQSNLTQQKYWWKFWK